MTTFAIVLALLWIIVMFVDETGGGLTLLYIPAALIAWIICAAIFDPTVLPWSKT